MTARGLFGLMLASLWIASCQPSDQQVSPPSQGGPAGFAQACAATEDCASLLCVGVGGTQGRCSRVCAVDADCPAAKNWRCLAPDGAQFQVCACLPDAQEEICGDGADNDCDGVVDDCLVCDGMQVPHDDHAHCGSCDRACRGDQTCEGGQCVCSNAALEECGGACVDTGSSSSHCGVCNRACGLGETCLGGVCGCHDDSAPDSCPGVGCVDIGSDAQNCGACGQPCPSGQVCVDGGCVCPTSAEADYCVGIGCVNLADREDHCGSCDNACTGGKVCNQGNCACPASVPWECSGMCVDTQTDAQHCGVCGRACPAGQFCNQGSCACTTSTLTVCEDGCVSTQSDEAHCGACDNPCGPGELCFAAQCTCPSALECGGVCVPVDDQSNCGACGHVCPPAQVCLGSVCSCSNPSLSPCQSQCVNPASDPLNCGSCGHACKNGEVCVSGSCGCPAQQTWCSETGTCTDLSTNPAHCGACAHACSPAQICVTAQCQCPAVGQTYCPQNDQCISLQTDASNCGACAHACSPAETCVGGQCRCPVAGQTYCAQLEQCVSLQSDPAYCGACDHACGSTQICSLGQCRCPTAGQAYCEQVDQCVNLQVDASHCGACDVACPAATHCVAGSCVCEQAGLTLCGAECADLKTDEAHCGTCSSACAGTMGCHAGLCRCSVPGLAEPVRVTTTPNATDVTGVAWNGTHVGAAYWDQRTSSSVGGNAYFTLLNPDGTRALTADTPLSVFASSDPANWGVKPAGADVVTNGSEFGVVWSEFTGAMSLMFRRIGADGAPIGPAVNVTTSTPGGLAAYPSRRPRLAFVPGQGYAVLTLDGDPNGNTLHFQRLGLDGSAPEPRVEIATPGSWESTSLAGSPTAWGILFWHQNKELRFVRLNLDGSVTDPPETITTTTRVSYPSLLWDGTTWIGAWVRNGSPTARVVLGRGPHLETAITVAAGVYDYTFNGVAAPSVDVRGTDLVFTWATRTTSSDGAMLSAQRFTVPSGPSLAPIPVTDPFVLVDTPTVADFTQRVIQLPEQDFLEAWADSRWGAREVCARTASTSACP